MLQWNHAFSNVEILPVAASFYFSFRLQWNHAFSNVEMAAEIALSGRVIRASMEPRFFKRGNEDDSSQSFII